MGGSLSTIRWTPYGPLHGNHDPSQPNNHNRSRQALRKSKSYPPGNNNNTSHSPSNSTSNTSYEQEEEFYDDLAYTTHGKNNPGNSGGNNSSSDHLGTSGILMGVNAPPLYDACLVGRWDEVLEICGVNEELSNDSSLAAHTMATHCSSSAGGESDAEHNEEDGRMEDGRMEDVTTWPSGEGREVSNDAAAADATPTNDIDQGNASTPNNNTTTTSFSSNHPCLQTRYADRRRNTPLHLACRRQPPPAVVRALLNHSPCGSLGRRTADGLTPLHFAAYCGATVEVISMLVDRMRSDAAVGRAMRLSSNLEGVDESENLGGGGDNGIIADTAMEEAASQLPSRQARALPPTRLLDRRQRTPLHFALSGFRTPIRPLIVRKLLAVDPASATLWWQYQNCWSAKRSYLPSFCC